MLRKYNKLNFKKAGYVNKTVKTITVTHGRCRLENRICRLNIGCMNIKFESAFLLPPPLSLQTTTL